MSRTVVTGIVLAGLLALPGFSAPKRDLAEIMRAYVSQRDGRWTLSRTLIDLDTGEATVSRAFPSIQEATDAVSWTGLNPEDRWRTYRKYRETYVGGKIKADFFDSETASEPLKTSWYTITHASGPDAHGWYYMEMTGVLDTGGGDVYDVHRTAHWNGDILISEFTVRPQGTTGPYRAWITNTLVRVKEE